MWTELTPAILLTALVMDLLLGDPRWFPHPVVGIGRVVGLLEHLLRRTIRWERFAGLLLLLLVCTVTYAAAALLLQGAYVVSSVLGAGLATLITWTCLAARSLHRESALVATALERGDLESARYWLSRIVGRDTEQLDEQEIWRALVETVAENSSDGVVAPLFYLMLGGPALGLAYKAVNTLDSMVGYRNERYLRFGWASARFDDLANWLPARLTGLLMVMVAPLVGLSGGNAFRIMLRDGRKHASPNSGVPEAAAAGALGVRLGGINCYQGRPQPKPTIGEPLRPLDRQAYWGAVRLMYAATVGMTILSLTAGPLLRRLLCEVT